MKWKVVKKRGRYHLYIWENDDWKFHKSYLTEKGAETAAIIMYDRRCMENS